MTAKPNYIVATGAGGTVAAVGGGGGNSGGGGITPYAYITGTAAVGATLTANAVGVVPATYQWYQNAVAIGGATASTYTVMIGDAGTTITVKVNGLYLSAGVNIPATQTFRSIGALGADITWVNSSLGHRLFTNAFYNGARMQKTGQPFVNCNRDATTGWPTEAFYVILSAGPNNGTTSFEGAVPSGSYSWSYSYDNTIGTTTLTMPTSGANTPVNSGVTGFSLGTPVVTGSTTKVPFTFTFASVGGTLNLSFDGPVTFVDCPIDGQSTCVGQPLCRNEALASYSQYGVIRTLDLLWPSTAPAAGGRVDILWSDRPPNYTGPQLAQDIVSWERACDIMLAIKNYPGSKTAKWMVNIPAYSNPASYAAPLATLMNTKSIPANFLELEYGNEPFNFGAGAASIRFHGWENAAMNTVNGIANWEVTTNASAPSALYQGPGQVISTMALDSAGNVTVTLTVNCNTLLDINSGLPYITNGASLLVVSNNVNFQALAQATDISRQMTVTSVGTNTFVYNTGVAVTTPVTITNSTASSIYFNTTSSLLTDNLSFAIGNLQKKWYLNQLYAFQQQWLTVRPKGTYHDRWYINISPLGGALVAGNKTRPFDLTYAAYLGGGNANAFIDAVAPATYTLPIGTVAAEADLFDSTKTTSFYHVLNDPTFGQTVNNQCRGLVYQCLVWGLDPITYEGGSAPQSTAAGANFVVAMNKDPLMEVYTTTHQQVVLNNGMRRYMNYHSSPRMYQDGASNNAFWQSMQFFSDSNTSTDPTYAPKKAALEKFNDTVFYTNINGNDLCTLDVATYQNATVLTGNDNHSVFTDATTGAIYWGTGSTSLTRNVDWVYCNNTFTSRTITVYGTDGVGTNTPVQVWMFAPDLSGGVTGVQLGTSHLPGNGNAGTGAAVGPCLDTFTWTPTLAGPYVIRLIIPSGSGTAPGIKKVVFS